VGNDKLFFEDMFNPSSGMSVENRITEMFNNGDLLLNMSDKSHISLIYGNQEVQITLDASLDQTTFNNIQNNDQDAKNQLLQQILQITM
jgi:hypothetical protein